MSTKVDTSPERVKSTPGKVYYHISINLPKQITLQISKFYFMTGNYLSWKSTIRVCFKSSVAHGVCLLARCPTVGLSVNLSNAICRAYGTMRTCSVSLAQLLCVHQNEIKSDEDTCVARGATFSTFSSCCSFEGRPVRVSKQTADWRTAILR